MKNIIDELKRIIKNIYRVIRLTIKSSLKNSVILIAMNVLMGLLVPVNLIIWKYVINTIIDGLNGESSKAIFFWLGIWTINTALINLGNRICNYLQNMQTRYINKYITKLILEKVERLEMSYFDIPSNYDKAEKANSSASSNVIQILDTVINVIRLTTTLIASIGLIITLEYKIIVIAVISIIPVFLMDLKNYTKEYQIYVERVSKLRYIEYLKEMIMRHENIKEIKVSRANSFFKNRIIDKTEQYIREDKKIKKGMIKEITLADWLQNILSYINKIYIIYIFIMKHLTIGDFTLFINSLNNVEYCFRSILNAISSIYNDNLYVDDLFNFLQENEEGYNYVADKTFPSTFKEIRFEHVYFKYPGTERYCLEDINITIKSNKNYALVGENGSGKTTLIKLLMGLYRPTKGNIYIDDVNVNDIARESLYKNMGVIFQDFIKYPLSIKENIGIGNIDCIDDEEKIMLAGKLTGIDSFVDKLPEKYETQLQKEWEGGVDISIGQWQKVAISRALVAESKIVILDEPTASLDPKAEYKLFKTLEQLMVDKTCLFITHRFANVQLAHEIIVVDKGRIAECNSHENLMKLDGIYAQLYRIQSKAYAS